MLRRRGKAKRVGRISTRKRGKSKVKQRELRARRYQTGLREYNSKFVRVNEAEEENSEVVQLENLRDEQRKDGELKLIIEWIEDPTKVTNSQSRGTTVVGATPQLGDARQNFVSEVCQTRRKSAILADRRTKKFTNGIFRRNTLRSVEWSSRN